MGLLFGVDWAPMLPGGDYSVDYLEPHLAELWSRLGGESEKPSTRIYGESPEFFSPFMFFARPEGPDALKPRDAGSEGTGVEEASHLWRVYEEYYTKYLSMLQTAPHAEVEEVAH